MELLLVYYLMIMCSMCHAASTIFASSKDRELGPKLREVVISLQEQLTALQQEQVQNRLVIQTLETRLEEELHQNTRTRRKQRQQHQPLHSEIAETDSKSASQPKTVDDDTDGYTIHSGRKAVTKRSNFGRMDVVDSWTKRLLSETTTPATSTSIPNPGGSTKICVLECQDIHDQLESLSEEIQKLRRDTEAQRLSVHENQDSELSDLKSEHVTIKWLQKTVVDLRKELSELAAALNISAAIRDNQQMEIMLDRLRSDIATLRMDVDHKNAGMTRQAVALDEIKEEIQEVRAIAATVITEHQQMVDEVNALKEELFRTDTDFHDPDSSEETTFEAEEGSVLEGSGEDEIAGESDLIKVELFGGSHHRGDHTLGVEVDSMKRTLHKIHQSQAHLDKEMKLLKKNHGLHHTALGNVQRTVARLDNGTAAMYGEQSTLSRVLDNVKSRLALAEEKVSRNGRNIVNITEAMTGMDKVHSSTIQLFEALESLEDEYSRSIGDLQKEVSKFEFNVAQVQGSFDILRHDQSSQYDDLKSLKVDFVALQRDFRKDHYRLTSIHNEFLNRSLQRCAKENQETMQNLKLANLELQLSKLAKKEEDHKMNSNMMYSKLMQKVDRNTLQSIELAHKQLVEEVRNASAILANVTEYQDKLKHELIKFVKHLPSDCSMSDVPDSAAEYRSGVYLVRIPHSHHAKEMYCDMSQADVRWTVIQRRTDGSVDFFRNWDDYRKGFGDPTGEFWAGNEAMHRMTQVNNYTLRIDMWDMFNRYLYAEYDNFKVSSEEDDYRLEVGQYSGNASDSLKYHHNMAFSTHDRDNDASSTHCAMYYSAGWWYQHCQYANINGRYAIGMTWYDAENKDWVQLAKVEMKIRVKPASS